MTTASGQASPDNAGDDPLSMALEAALGSTDMEEAAFAEPATAPAKGKTTEPVERASETATEDVPGDEAQEAPAGETPEASTQSGLTAPAHWDAPRREAFGKLTPDAQKLVLDTVKGFEGEFTRKSTELAEERKFAQGIRSLITDEHKRQMRESGMDEVGGVNYLLRLNDYARAQPREYARWFFGNTRLDPRQVFPEFFAGAGQQPQGQPGQPGQPRPQQPDPNTQQLYSALNPLLNTVQGIQQELQRTKLTAADRALTSFRDAKSADGAPAHPHIAAVEREMVDLLQTPTLQSIDDYGARLQRAYEIAVANNGELRSQTITAEVERRVAAERDKARKESEAAKARRAKAPARSSPTGAVTPKKQTLDEVLRQSMDSSGV